jgi:hypothetical protein
MALDLNFSSELVLNSCFDQLLLIEYFKGYDKLRSFLSGQVHMSKFSPSHWLADFEIIYWPFLWVEFLRCLELGSLTLNLLDLICILLLKVVSFNIIFPLISNRLIWRIILGAHLNLILQWLSNRNFWHRLHVDVRRWLVVYGCLEIVSTHFLVDLNLIRTLHSANILKWHRHLWLRVSSLLNVFQNFRILVKYITWEHLLPICWHIFQKCSLLLTILLWFEHFVVLLRSWPHRTHRASWSA